MVEISTSLLSVEKENVIKTIYNLETAKTDYFHIDVMDGEFVKDNTIKKMLEYSNYLTNITNIPLDIHLMVKNVKECIDLFLPYNPSNITIHYESVNSKNELLELINYIKLNNSKVGISIKPNTDLEEILDIICNVNIILIMTVEPGQGGQKLIPETLNKIRKTANYVRENNLNIIVEADGGINLNNIQEVKNAGADIVVSGTGIINSNNYRETISIMKQN